MVSLASARRNSPEVTTMAAVATPAAQPNDDEEALVARCLAGDPEGFRPLVQRYQRLVFSVAVRMLGNRADAEDVAQQAFVDAYAALDRFRPDGRANAFSTWLLRIVINGAKDVLKSKKRTEVALPEGGHEGEAMFSHVPGSPEAKAGQAQDRRRLERALAAVPAKYREVLVLKDIEELSYDDIRQVLRLPVTTLKMRVVRARAMMREALSREEP